MGKNYWMMVASPEDFEITKQRGFTIYGVRGKYRRRAQRMQPDDRILFYVKGLRKWTATATITSQFFEDRTPIWNVDGRVEVYPFRVRTKPEIVLGEADYIDALLLAPRLDYVKRWAPEDWPLAFFESLHLIPQKDFRLIEAEMTRIVGPSRNGRPRGGSNGPNNRRNRHNPQHRERHQHVEYHGDRSNQQASVPEHSPQPTPVQPYDEHENHEEILIPDQTTASPPEERESQPPVDSVVESPASEAIDEHGSAPEADQRGHLDSQDSIVDDHPATDDSSTGSSST